MTPDQIDAVQRFMDETAAWMAEVSMDRLVLTPVPTAPDLAALGGAV